MVDRQHPVLYFTRFVPGYRVPVLEALNKRLDDGLVVCAGEPPPGSSLAGLSRTDRTGYRRHTLKNSWIGGDRLHWQPFDSALNSYPDSRIVLAEESPRSLSLPFLMRNARRRDCGTILWGHFSSNSRPLGSPDLRDRYRVGLARRADAAICYTDQVAKDLGSRIGTEKVFVARNTLDTPSLFALHQRLEKEGKKSVRDRLRLPDKPTILFLGRLIRDKGIYRVLETAAVLGKGEVSLVIIGDGPERIMMERQAAELELTVRFLGAVTDLSESAPFIFASDVLLNPGYLGLSINHAFSLGVPVIAPAPVGESRMHSPEWSYIASGENGILTPSDSAEDLAGGIRAILASQAQFSAAASEYSRAELGLDRMIDGLEDAIRFVLHERSERN